MLSCLSMLKEKSIKEKKPFFSLIEKDYFLFKPENALVAIRGAGGQASMVLEQSRGKKKPKEICSCYLYGKKGYIAENYWCSIGG